MYRVASACAALVILATSACSPSATSSVRPQDVLVAYAAAVQAARYEDAYNLMSLEFRKRYDRKEFVRMLAENAAEMKLSVQHLRGKASEVKVSANLEYGDGDALRLIVENENWRIASNPVEFYAQRTPAEALRSFVRAIERRRYDIVLRFVPAKWAETMTVDKLRKQWEGEKQGEVNQLLKNLKANLNAPIHITGNTATMPYGDNFEVRFVREDGVWKIEDPD